MDPDSACGLCAVGDQPILAVFIILWDYWQDLRLQNLWQGCGSGIPDNLTVWLAANSPQCTHFGNAAWQLLDYQHWTGLISKTKHMFAARLASQSCHN